MELIPKDLQNFLENEKLREIVSQRFESLSKYFRHKSSEILSQVTTPIRYFRIIWLAVLTCDLNRVQTKQAYSSWLNTYSINFIGRKNILFWLSEKYEKRSLTNYEITTKFCFIQKSSGRAYLFLRLTEEEQRMIYKFSKEKVSILKQIFRVDKKKENVFEKSLSSFESFVSSLEKFCFENESEKEEFKELMKREIEFGYLQYTKTKESFEILLSQYLPLLETSFLQNN